MSQSLLVSYTKYSPFLTQPRNHVIDSVAIHIMAGDMSIESCGAWFATPGVRASSHYGIGSDGRIGQYLKEEWKAWCTSSPAVDHRAITIEIANYQNAGPKGDWPISDKAWDSLINLLVDICSRNRISRLSWMADAAYARRVAANGSVDKQNIFAHRWFAPKVCPGDYLYTRMGTIANQVNARLAAGGVLGVVPVGSNINGGTLASPEFPVDLSAIKPYMAMVSRKSNVTKDYIQKLKDNGVCGMIVEAGYLYNSNGDKVSRFRNPKVHDQVTLLSANNMPFAFYMTGRANGTLQADKEIEELAKIVRTLPPELGVWIRTDFPSANKVRNDLVIKKYQTELERLGLKARIGLITNRTLIQKFNWSKHQDDWAMLYEDPIESTSELGSLLTPEFFDLEGRYT